MHAEHPLRDLEGNEDVGGVNVVALHDKLIGDRENAALRLAHASLFGDGQHGERDLARRHEPGVLEGVGARGDALVADADAHAEDGGRRAAGGAQRSARPREALDQRRLGALGIEPLARVVAQAGRPERTELLVVRIEERGVEAGLEIIFPLLLPPVLAPQIRGGKPAARCVFGRERPPVDRRSEAGHRVVGLRLDAEDLDLGDLAVGHLEQAVRLDHG